MPPKPVRLIWRTLSARGASVASSVASAAAGLVTLLAVDMMLVLGNRRSTDNPRVLRAIGRKELELCACAGARAFGTWRVYVACARVCGVLTFSLSLSDSVTSRR